MSFGFSVGDFITVGDKAWVIYRKCKDAPEDYQQLTHYVNVLGSVLDEAREFMSGDDVPSSEHRIASLASAGHACKTTLVEVEDFLDKHGRVGGKSKRFIDTFRFVSSDIQALRSRLQMSTQLLQLSLASLSSLSFVQIRANLKDIVREYQTGTREPTVLSSVIQNGGRTQADGEEVYDQLVADLEANEVHPDCIALHDDRIRGWLQDITLDGILDEAAPDDPDDPDPPDTESIRGLSATSQVMLDVPSSDYPGSSPATTLPGYPEEDHAYPWTPPDQPDTGHVQKLLGALLDADPYLPYDPDTARPRAQRAFERLDYTQRSYLTRGEVVKATQEALEYAGITSARLDSLNLPVVISTFDVTQEGRYDESKFISIIRHVVQLAFKAMREQLADATTRCGIKARAFLREQRKAQVTASSQGQGSGRPRTGSHRYALPFGWSENGQGSALRFHDRITDKDWEVPLELRSSVFSIMAVEAAWCVEEIDSLEAKWLATVPRTRRSTFLENLNTVRSVALRYTEFEKASNPYELSDLDDFVTSFQIIQQLGSDTLPDRRLPGIARDLEEARNRSYNDLTAILAFVQLLNEALAFEPAVHRFPELSTAWRKSQAPVASRLILRDSEHWGVTVQHTSRCRRVDINGLHDQALALAKDYMHREALKIRVEGTVARIFLEGFRFSKPPKWSLLTQYIRVTISIDDDDCVITTLLIPYDHSGVNYSWKPRSKMHFYQWSKIQLRIFYGSVEGIYKAGKKPVSEMVFQLNEKLDMLRADGDIHTVEVQSVEGYRASLTFDTGGQAELLRAAQLSLVSELIDLPSGKDELET